MTLVKCTYCGKDLESTPMELRESEVKEDYRKELELPKMDQYRKDTCQECIDIAVTEKIHRLTKQSSLNEWENFVDLNREDLITILTNLLKEHRETIK